MRVSRFRNGVVLACVLLVAGIATTGSALAQPDDLAALNQRISELYSAAQYAEAIPLAERSLELIRSQKGQDHVDTATRMAWVALLYRYQGRTAEAEPLFKRTVSILEKALGSDRPDVGLSLHHLAELYRNQGRYAEAEPLYLRSWPFSRRRSGPTTAMSVRRSTTSPTFIVTRAAPPRPSSYSNARLVFTRRRWALTIPSSASRSSTWPSCIATRAASARPSS